jgi:hypothetical protein
MREDNFQEVRQSLAKALLLLTSLAVCLLGLELLCRFYLQPHANDAGDLAGPHPVFGRHFKPGQKGRYVAARFDQYIEINSKGLRDREYSYEKREGTFRILLLADSFGAAMQVPLETAFHSVLERELNENPALPAVDVINAGYPGWGTAQQTLFYRHEGSKYSPDLVLVAFFVNDVIDNYRWARRGRTSDGSERGDAVELSRGHGDRGGGQRCSWFVADPSIRRLWRHRRPGCRHADTIANRGVRREQDRYGGGREATHLSAAAWRG